MCVDIARNTSQQIRPISIDARHSCPRRALQERHLKLDLKMTLKTVSSLCKSLPPSLSMPKQQVIENVMLMAKMLLRSKREIIIRQLRDDVAQFLKNGQDESAFARVEQLFKDQNILAAYDLLDHFCEFLIINLPYIRRNKYELCSDL